MPPARSTTHGGDAAIILGGLALGFLSDALSLEAAPLLAGLACAAVALFAAFFMSVPAGRHD